MFLLMDEAADVTRVAMRPIAALQDGKLRGVECHRRSRVRARCHATVKGAQRTRWEIRVREDATRYVVQARIVELDGKRVPAGSWRES